MHGLIEAMGQEIVRRQSIHELGKRSRLWNHEDIYHVLRQKTGTEAVQCISLDICKIKQINLHANTFEKMNNLRLLHFHMSNPEEHSKVRVSGGLEIFPYNLRVLQWDRYPLRSLPSSFLSENLVELDMRNSQLEKLWDEDQKLPNLRRIDLRGSKHLGVLPDLSHAPNIEEIILNDCTSLLQVYSSNSLVKLNRLWLDGCAKLKDVNLPRNVYRRSSWLVASYSYLDLENFSFNKVKIRLSVPEHSNISIFKFQAVSFPFRGITESMDSLECEELKLLGESLTSLLPYLSELRWSSSIVNLSKLFELDLSYYNTHETASGNSSILKFTILKLMRASPRISTTAKCSIYKKEIAVNEVVSSLEDLIEPKELTLPLVLGAAALALCSQSSSNIVDGAAALLAALWVSCAPSPEVVGSSFDTCAAALAFQLLTSSFPILFSISACLQMLQKLGFC
ncbi:hypothetical protein L6164_013412 [Bauhinia variegata]|uniref:Uncharacterized protein n=1 Tax=Bauhinia variegata TaxID=167791 RepID=A0ACB9NFA0_BAUVA|nr:hypothetical protein L6164_013412 [Bauhinia variegata]